MNEMFLRFCYIQEGFRLNLLSSASACSGLAYVLRLFPKKKIYILLWMKKKAPQVFKVSLCSVCVLNGKDRQMIKKSLLPSLAVVIIEKTWTFTHIKSWWISIYQFDLISQWKEHLTPSFCSYDKKWEWYLL